RGPRDEPRRGSERGRGGPDPRGRRQRLTAGRSGGQSHRFPPTCERAEEATMNEVERGSVLPLLAVVLLVATALVVAIGRLGEAAVARAHARAAADAAALAGAAESRAAAAALAAANG